MERKGIVEVAAPVGACFKMVVQPTQMCVCGMGKGFVCDTKHALPGRIPGIRCSLSTYCLEP